jgi:hypothetical protein
MLGLPSVTMAAVACASGSAPSPSKGPVEGRLSTWNYRPELVRENLDVFEQQNRDIKAVGPENGPSGAPHRERLNTQFRAGKSLDAVCMRAEDSADHLAPVGHERVDVGVAARADRLDAPVAGRVLAERGARLRRPRRLGVDEVRLARAQVRLLVSAARALDLNDGHTAGAQPAGHPCTVAARPVNPHSLEGAESPRVP